MWIEKINGKYRAIERYRDPLTGKDRRVSVIMEKNTASSRKAAEMVLISKIQDKLKIHGCEENVTVADLVAHWLCSKKGTVKESTYFTYEVVGRSVTEFLGEDTLVNNLTARHINQLLDKHTSSVTSRNTFIHNIKSIIKWGFNNDYVEDVMWLSKITTRPDRSKSEKLSNKFLESDELTELLNNMKSDTWRDLTDFLAHTGLRIGEAMALDYSDIDLEHRLIRVTKTLNVHLEKCLSPKTPSSERDVYIQDSLFPLCKKLRARASANRMVDTKVFPGCKYTSYRSYLVRNSRKIIGKEITPHYLRHTHVALLAEQGIPLDVISRRLGHNDSSTTRDVYFHVTRRLKERDIQLLKSVNIV